MINFRFIAPLLVGLLAAYCSKPSTPSPSGPAAAPGGKTDPTASSAAPGPNPGAIPGTASPADTASTPSVPAPGDTPNTGEQGSVESAEAPPTTNQAPVVLNSAGGAVVSFPPGTIALSEDDHLFIEDAANLTEQGALADLPVQGDTEVVRAGDAVVIVPAQETPIAQAFTISLTLDAGAGLHLSETDANFAVLYKTVEGTTFKSGLLPLASLTKTDDHYALQVSAYGAYQLVELNDKFDEPMVAASSLKFIQTAARENLVDDDGVGKPIVSLRPVARRYPLEPTAPYRYFVNAEHASAYPLAGRCSRNGAEVKITGAATGTAVCAGYAWDAGTVDLSALPEGALTLTLTMTSAAGIEDQEDILLQKDTAPPTLDLAATSPLHIGTSGGSFQFTGSSDVENVAWTTTSGPAELFVTLYGNLPSATLELDATQLGEHKLLVEVLDLAGNIAAREVVVVAEGVAEIVAVAPPGGFQVNNNPGERSTTYSVSQGEGQTDAASGGYLVVRRAGAPVTFTPADGTTYTLGDFVDSHHKIVLIHPFHAAGGTLEANLLFGQTYHYKVFMYNAIRQYSTGLEDEVTLQQVTNSQIAAAGGFFTDVAVGGDKLYAAKDKRGLEIYDIAGSNASTPLLLGALDLDGAAKRIAVSGNYAYVAEEQGGMTIIDVSNPAAPLRVSNIKPELSTYFTVFVSGNYAYLGSMFLVHVIDVTNKASPSKVGEFSMQNPGRMAIDGNTLFVVDSDGIHKVDVTNKTAPSVISNTAGGYGFFGLAVDATNIYAGAYISGNDGVAKFERSNLALSAGAGYYTPSDSTIFPDLVKHGSYLLVANGLQGVFTSTLAPGIPGGGTVVENTDGFAQAIAVHAGNNRAYVADGDAGLVTLDVSSVDTALTKTSTIPTLSNSEEVAIANNRAYLADAYNGLMIYDVSTLSAPKYEGRYKVTGNYGYSVVVANSVAYVAMDDEGVHAVDVDDPTAPTMLHKNDTLDDVKHVTLAGSRVLASVNDGAGGGGLYVLSSTLAIEGSITGFQVAQAAYDGTRYAYVVSNDATAEDRLRVIDLQNPAAPAVVANVGVGARGAIAVAYAAGRVFVTNTDFGTFPSPARKLKIFDVANPTSPTVLGMANLANIPTKALQVSGDFVYVGLGSTGVGMFHIGDVATPVTFGTMKVSNDAKGIALTSTHLFVADGYDGLTIHTRVE